MGNIETYLKSYGKYTFLEKEFNEVDNVILSLISYIDLYDIVPGIKEGKITLKDASKKFYNKYSQKEINQNIVAVKGASNLLKELASTKRYKDLLLYNYVYKVTFDMQFGALCIMLPNKNVYVSYEGTDGYVSGWKEDCMLACSFPNNAQIEAINYLNKVVGLFSHGVYVGGHSKGGHLAIVAGMFCKSRVRRKIISIFNNDGPGLRNKEFESNKYKRVNKKLVYIVPKGSIVGMLLCHNDNPVVVDSKARGIMQHSALSWIVEEDKFKRAKLSESSIKFDTAVATWISKLDDKQRLDFINGLFSVLKKADINSLVELKKAKLDSTIKIIKETKNMNKETRNMLLVCFKDLYEEIRK